HCARDIPAYKPLSVSGYHIREAGATAAQELAYTLADGFGYVELGLSRGLDVDTFAPGLSFFFDAHLDFFEEIAKYRAGRRRGATIVRERYGATTDKASMFRFGCVAGGASLYAPQAQNNLVRVAYESLAAVLGGVQSMF
ncbi:methylmalonyl-CoA mutase family protein, partial [Streptomyces evansiae]|uniref:methylmalonyl-CoA mutase family protein n=1 Tax=Streptomyces evansiae TaxID=3075535 RepID=UPI002884F75E